jgi:pimeloyl-ACP methyl ester carboxylesterase
MDLTLHHEEHGAGPPVVFLHGFGTSLETWRDIQPRVAAHVRAVLVDLKGFGRSPKPPDGRYTLTDHGALVAAFIVEHGLKGCAIVGHSYGGAVALTAYLRLLDTDCGWAPSRLVLIDAAADAHPLPLFVGVLRIPVINTLLLNLVPARTRARAVLNGLFHDRRLVTEERVERVARFFDAPGAHHSFVTAARQVVRREANVFRRRLGDVSAPTLIIWGREDRALPLAYADYFRREIRGSRLAWIDACNHIPQEEKPEECARLMLDFLSARP